MRANQAERLEERAEERDQGVQVVPETVRQCRRGAEPGEIHGYDVPLGRQDAQDGLPRLMVMTDAVQQHQRLTGAAAFVRDSDDATAGGRVDCERDRGGHAAPRDDLRAGQGENGTVRRQ